MCRTAEKFILIAKIVTQDQNHLRLRWNFLVLSDVLIWRRPSLTDNIWTDVNGSAEELRWHVCVEIPIVTDCWPKKDQFVVVSSIDIDCTEEMEVC